MRFQYIEMWAADRFRRCGSMRILSENTRRLMAGDIYPHRPQQIKFSKFSLLPFSYSLSHNTCFLSRGMQSF